MRTPMIAPRHLLNKLFTRSAPFALIDKAFYFLACHVFGYIWKVELAIRGVRPWSALRKTTIVGRPIVGMGIGSTIRIGECVILMSSSRYCFSASLYGPCKIQTISPSARIHLGEGASFNGTSIVCRSSKISIGARTMIGPNVTIVDSPFHPVWPPVDRNAYSGTELDASVDIGQDVWIGAQVIVLPGSRIGRGSVIAAGSIVKGEVPPNCLAAGSPARVVRTLD
jgi:acetyltransferase-like isoleucine patch superfamily enzyme